MSGRTANAQDIEYWEVGEETISAGVQDVVMSKRGSWVIKKNSGCQSDEKRKKVPGTKNDRGRGES